MYFSGIHWWGGERTFAMVLPAKGAAFYVCPAFEEGRAREQISKSPDSGNADVRIWQEDESPYQRIVQALKQNRYVLVRQPERFGQAADVGHVDASLRSQAPLELLERGVDQCRCALLASRHVR